MIKATLREALALVAVCVVGVLILCAVAARCYCSRRKAAHALEATTPTAAPVVETRSIEIPRTTANHLGEDQLDKEPTQEHDSPIAGDHARHYQVMQQEMKREESDTLDSTLDRMLHEHRYALRILARSGFEINPDRLKNDPKYRSGVQALKRAVDTHGLSRIKKAIQVHNNRADTANQNSLDNDDQSADSLWSRTTRSYPPAAHQRATESRTIEVWRATDGFLSMLLSGPPMCTMHWRRRCHEVFPRRVRLAVRTILLDSPSLHRFMPSRLWVEVLEYLGFNFSVSERQMATRTAAESHAPDNRHKIAEVWSVMQGIVMGSADARAKFRNEAAAAASAAAAAAAAALDDVEAGFGRMDGAAPSRGGVGGVAAGTVARFDDQAEDDARWVALATVWVVSSKRFLCNTDPPVRNLGAQLLMSLERTALSGGRRALPLLSPFSPKDDGRLKWLRRWQCPAWYVSVSENASLDASVALTICISTNTHVLSLSLSLSLSRFTSTLNNILEVLVCPVCQSRRPEGLGNRAGLRDVLISWSKEKKQPSPSPISVRSFNTSGSSMSGVPSTYSSDRRSSSSRGATITGVLRGEPPLWGGVGSAASGVGVGGGGGGNVH